MSESQQHKLDRVRPPRVQITYDVETNGAMEKKELPFTVGVIADLSGHRPEKELGPLKNRPFTEIDRDNVDAVLEEAAPQLNLNIDNKLSDDATQLRMELKFRSMDDFSPAAVAEQVAPLKELLDMRRRLDEILSKVSTNGQLESALQDVIANTEKVQSLARQMGINPESEGK